MVHRGTVILDIAWSFSRSPPLLKVRRLTPRGYSTTRSHPNSSRAGTEFFTPAVLPPPVSVTGLSIRYIHCTIHVTANAIFRRRSVSVCDCRVASKYIVHMFSLTYTTIKKVREVRARFQSIPQKDLVIASPMPYLLCQPTELHMWYL